MIVARVSVDKSACRARFLVTDSAAFLALIYSVLAAGKGVILARN
jgi:hypothetical protein